MSGGIYGGDEVSGLVFDAGSHSFRVGFAGEEFPKGDIPSYVARQEVLADDDITMKEDGDASVSNNIKNQIKYHIGTTKIIVPRANTTLESFMKDGMIEDWDQFEHLLDYAYSDILHSESQYHPALFSESAWNVKEKREKLTELMFEKYNVPAYFLVKNAVLACFSNGRTGGLVVDSGSSMTSAVPVYDGYAVTHAVTRSALGGDMVCEQIEHMLKEQNIDLVPTYKIATKEEVNENESPKWTMKKNLPDVTESYDKFMRKQILEDMSACVLQVNEGTTNVEHAEKLPSSPYSFPNGYTREFLAERHRVVEGLYDLGYLKNVPKTETLLSVSQLATTAAGMCDIDIRQHLFSNIIVSGGNSLIFGFSERLHHEISMKCPPAVKIRVTAPVTPMERRFGPWVGGSILASLGNFQQMWVSRAEYDEGGKNIVEKKCP